MQVSEAALVASVCRASFREFVKEFVGEVIPGPFRWNWHIDLICDELQEIAERVFKAEPRKHDLCCNISPGTTKSTLFSVLFPAWVWTRMPHAQFIGASYSDDLALELARKNRDVVLSEKYKACFPEIQLREDQNTKGNFVNTKGGKRYAVGSGGTVVGFHAHFIIIDDPINPAATLSAAELFRTNEWIKTSMSGRKVDKAVTVTIMVMQRLHVDDPTAQMVKGKRVRWLRIPATTEFPINPPELAKYYVNGLMDPVGLPRDYLEELVGPGGIGEMGLSCQYGQNPLPRGGGMFKVEKLRWGRPPEKFVRVVRAWDKAATPGKASMTTGPAWTVGALEAKDDQGRIWVLDVIRVRLDSASRENLIARTAKRDGYGVEIYIEQEPGSSGIDSALATVKRLLGYRVRPKAASGSKEVRADEFSVAVNSGLVWLPEVMRDGNAWSGWAEVFVEEMTHWPNTTYLDQIDSAALGYNALVRAKVKIGTVPSRKKKEENRVLANRSAFARTLRRRR